MAITKMRFSAECCSRAGQAKVGGNRKVSKQRTLAKAICNFDLDEIEVDEIGPNLLTLECSGANGRFVNYSTLL
jgi:hypothetical protein